MLDKLRRPGRSRREGSFKKLFSYIIFGFICIIFVFLAPLSPQLFGGGAVAYVGSEVISSRDFSMIQENLRNAYRDTLNKADAESAQRLEAQIRQRALSQLITTSLIFQGSQKAGFVISDAALQDEIKSFPVFQRDGRFVYSLYLRVLKNQRTSVIKFEERVYQDKMNRNWRNLFQKSIQATILDQNKIKEQASYKMSVSIAPIPIVQWKVEDLESLESFIQKGQLSKINSLLKTNLVSWKRLKKVSFLKPFPFVQTGYENEKLRKAILEHLPNKGLVPKLVRISDKAYVIQVLNFKNIKPVQTQKTATLSPILHFQKSAQIFDSWLGQQNKQFPVKQTIEL